ncbi:hypothetical protein EDD86DRAFT_205700 [Gorgonomyces haynaldii]|nr:hypothetical protein EDD86DRAFT_205700 [Gorgonomyces haynaldii]
MHYDRLMNVQKHLDVPINTPRIKAHFDPKHRIFCTNPEQMPQGLDYIPNFLSEQEQRDLLELVYSQPFVKVIKRRQQFYGPVYYHTTPNIASIQPKEDSEQLDLSLLQPYIDRIRELGFFPDAPPDQVLVNEYVGVTGISSHYDDEQAFGDTILTLSLGQPIWLSLRKPVAPNNQCLEYLKQTDCFVEPGSLFSMRGEVRSRWRHGISMNAKWIHHPEGYFIRRDDSCVRVSLTFRHLLRGRKRVQQDDIEWVENLKVV